MNSLTKAEEQLMQYLWEKNQCFMKELIEAYTDPKPASTTVATLLKRLSDKKFIDYKLYGNSRQYYPLVKKSDYFSRHVNNIIKNFFNDSASQFASFFTTETNLSNAELEDLKKLIEKKIANEK